MRKGLTEIVFILDRSGSMSGLEPDTIGGFNSMIEKQKKEKGEAVVSTVLFDDRCEVLYDRIPMEDVPVMTEEEYFVRGCTALLDALGGAIKHIGDLHKEMKKDERPEKTLFVITTDGMENASRHYSYEKIKKVVESRQKKHGWEFLFIGANIDSITEAARFGIQKDRAVNYVHDSVGTATVFASVGRAVGAVRSAETLCCSEALDASGWVEEIKEDYKKRAGKKATKKSAGIGDKR